MQFRTFTEQDFKAMQTLDHDWQHQSDVQYDQLPERERESRLSTSLPALKFYERSEHSFVAENKEGHVCGFILAQSVWQGDKPIVLVRTLLHMTQGDEVAQGLLHATVKSAYDCAVYEIHLANNAITHAAAMAEEAHMLGQYIVCHLGTRAKTAPGEKLA